MFNTVFIWRRPWENYCFVLLTKCGRILVTFVARTSLRTARGFHLLFAAILSAGNRRWCKYGLGGCFRFSVVLSVCVVRADCVHAGREIAFAWEEEEQARNYWYEVNTTVWLVSLSFSLKTDNRCDIVTSHKLVPPRFLRALKLAFWRCMPVGIGSTMGCLAALERSDARSWTCASCRYILRGPCSPWETEKRAR